MQIHIKKKKNWHGEQTRSIDEDLTAHGNNFSTSSLPFFYFFYFHNCNLSYIYIYIYISKRNYWIIFIPSYWAKNVSFKLCYCKPLCNYRTKSNRTLTCNGKLRWKDKGQMREIMKWVTYNQGDGIHEQI
jgi:hypothetical protein